MYDTVYEFIWNIMFYLCNMTLTLLKYKQKIKNCFTKKTVTMKMVRFDIFKLIGVTLLNCKF